MATRRSSPRHGPRLLLVIGMLALALFLVQGCGGGGGGGGGRGGSAFGDLVWGSGTWQGNN